MRIEVACSRSSIKLLTAVIAVGAVFTLGNAPAKAVTVSCYGSSPNFSVTTTPGATCVGTGLPQNDINNGVPASFPAGYVLLDKSDDASSGVVGWKNATSFTGSTSGTFTITPGAGFNPNTLILAFKDGSLPGGVDPGYGAFLLNGSLAGLWAILFDHAVSHFTLYGQACTECPTPQQENGPTTPIPGAVWLFGTVLAGGAGYGRWRKKRKAQLAAAA